jgi:hypothetical protein
VNNKFFRRLKVENNAFSGDQKFLNHWWLIIRVKISHRCNFINLNTFDLMTALVASKFFRRSKVANYAFSTFNLLFIHVTSKFFRISKVASNAFASLQLLIS